MTSSAALWRQKKKNTHAAADAAANGRSRVGGALQPRYSAEKTLSCT